MDYTQVGDWKKYTLYADYPSKLVNPPLILMMFIRSPKLVHFLTPS